MQLPCTIHQRVAYALPVLTDIFVLLRINEIGPQMANNQFYQFLRTVKADGEKSEQQLGGL